MLPASWHQTGFGLSSLKALNPIGPQFFSKSVFAVYTIEITFAMVSIQPAFVEHTLCAGPELSSKGFQFCIFIQKDEVLSFWFIFTGRVFKT